MAGYDPSTDPYLQAALSGSGSSYAPFDLPSGSAPFTQDEMAVMSAMGQQNAPGMAVGPEIAPTPQALPGGQPLPLHAAPAQAAPVGPSYTGVPVSQLRGQTQQDESDGYRMPDLSQMGHRRGGGAPSQAKAKMEGAFGGMTDAITQRQEAAREIADTRASVGRPMADIRSNANVDDEMYAQRMADEAERHQGAVDAVQARQRDDAEFIRTFEPSDRRSTGQKVMSALAVAMSGIGDAIAMGGGNANPGGLKTTLGIIDKSIDRDLEYQREMLNNKRTALAASNTELGQMRERYGDNLDSMKMARVVKLDQYQRAIDTAIQQGASAEAVAAGKDTQAQLELQKQQLMYDVYGAQYQAEMRARAGGGAMSALKHEEQMLKNANLRKELGEGKPLTAEQKKRQSFLTGTEDSARMLARAVGQGRAAPGMVGRNTPDMLKSSPDIELENATAAVEAILLRDESGASISESDQAAKRAGWGRDRGDVASRKRALQLMLNEYNARRASTGLAPVEPVDIRGE